MKVGVQYTLTQHSLREWKKLVNKWNNRNNMIEDKPTKEEAIEREEIIAKEIEDEERI